MKVIDILHDWERSARIVMDRWIAKTKRRPYRSIELDADEFKADSQLEMCRWATDILNHPSGGVDVLHQYVHELLKILEES